VDAIHFMNLHNQRISLVCVCDYRQGMDWWMDLLTPYTHHLELLSPISTLYRSSQHPLSLFQTAMSSTAVPWQRLITVEILQLPALRSSCHSCPCRTLVNCQLNYSAISSQPPLQSSTELSTLNCQLTTQLVNLNVFKITPWSGPHRKHHSSIVVCMFVSAVICL
jgi:hypothetical protein